MTTAVFSSLALASCGAGGSDSSAPPPISSAPTPTPTASPSPIPSPTPTPAASYKTYAQLVGDQTFKSACVTFDFGVDPIRVTAATEFGAGLTLDYIALTDSYVSDRDNISAVFTPADHDPAASINAKAYRTMKNGYEETFSINQTVLGGAGPEYTRRFSYSTRRPWLYHNLCVFGVPTLISDVPAATTVSFTRGGVSGTAYRSKNGVTGTYSLEASTVTLTVNLMNGAMTGTINLVGTIRLPTGAGPQAELGTYNITGTIDPDIGSYSGELTASGRPSVVGGLGGWFFGPQGREAAYAFSIANQGETGVDRIAGSVTAAR